MTRYIEITPDGLPLQIVELFNQYGPLLVESSSNEEAAALQSALSHFSFSTELFAPSFLLLERGEVDPQADVALAHILHSSPDVIITTPSSLRLALPHKILTGGITLKTGDSFDLLLLATELVKMGYQRLPLVRQRGEFAIKGDIIDIATGEAGIGWRVEFFDDEIERISHFSLASQRNKDGVESASITPLLLTTSLSDGWKKRILELIPNLSTLQLIESEELIESGVLSAWDSYPLTKGEGGVFSLHERTFIQWNRQKGEIEHEELLAQLTKERKNRVKNGAFSPFPLEASFIEELPYAEVRLASLFSSAGKIEKRAITHTKITKKEHQHPELLIQRLLYEKKELILMGNRDQVAAFEKLIEKDHLPLIPVEKLPLKRERESAFLLRHKPWFSGESIVEFRETGTNLIPLSLFFLTKQVVRKRKQEEIARRESEETLALEQLNPGEFIVHYTFGIAVFEGITSIARTDCLILRYAQDDKLYLPVYNMHLLYKYRFDSATLPVISSLRTQLWINTRGRIKKDIEKVAEHILELYAQREVEQGTALEIVGVMLQKFSAAFPYQETRDQATTIRELLTDLSSGRVVDRLLIGDVGFGKTEIAMRGCMVGVMNEMQSAILVPTTVLASQHLKTFRERFEDFPVNIQMVSRFNSDAENREVLKGVASGKVDIIIGTHRLLSKDISFHNLGFLVVDEEHRFGVSQKEKIKELRHGVATLSMTATPIPRSLQMSLLGVRDISFIRTAPGERRPVKTYLLEYSDAIIKDAILSELQRDGQIYFVHNRVRSLLDIKRRLLALIPDLTIAIAHGQMEENELEKIMVDFTAGKYRLLLATTLIESGIDIPLVNTIIINRADMFGMAQLYQLRGRVGRGNRDAFAFLLVPSLTTLTKEAASRLSVMKQFDGLGNGYDVAMEDLSLRGGGNILGLVQSGKLKGVGYDLYLEMLRRRISALRGGDMASAEDIELKLNINASFPEEYIPDSHLRVSFYRKLSRTENMRQLSGIRQTLIEMFGKLPTESQTLFDATALRISAHEAGFIKVELAENSLTLETSSSKPPKSVEKLFEFIDAHRGRFSSESALTFPVSGLESARKLIDQLKIYF
ncbi:transcription-repair coupling factor [bacterium]|nr:transcription-repair coupling factor [bacterium]